MDKKLTREEQWIANSKLRRQEIKDAGGRQILVMVTPEDNAMLDYIIERRKKPGKRFSLTEWVSMMIRADFLSLKRASVRRRGAGGDR